MRRRSCVYEIHRIIPFVVEKSATTSEVQENLLCCAAIKARNKEGSPSLRHIAYIYIRLIIYGEDASAGKQLWFCKASPGETQQSFLSLWPPYIH